MRLILLALLIAGPVAAAQPVAGRWMTPARDSVVEIGKCGAAVCGKVVRLLKPVEGGPATDRNNPDAALRARPLLGLPILTDFIDKGSQWSGTIYDPRNGKSYRSNLKRTAEGQLNVQGCIAFFCQTQVWTRTQ